MSTSGNTPIAQKCLPSLDWMSFVILPLSDAIEAVAFSTCHIRGRVRAHHLAY